ncbi:MAG: molecular chaperone HtpG [Clostridia bacterium]
MAEKGTISIHAENIMPVIKRWLYSDKDIFLRELVSNGCDAIAKHKMLVLKGEAEAEANYRVDVIADEAEGTLKIIDNGIGMTQDEVKRFISQVAFSGAEEFLNKYKPEEGQSGGIIGHFGLGFYSAFMVSSKVVIDTMSYLKDAQPVRWESADGMAYDLDASERTTRGTTITLFLNAEDREFLARYTLRETLEKYCAFMPVAIFLSEVKPAQAHEDPAHEDECTCGADHAHEDECTCGADHAHEDECTCGADHADHEGAEGEGEVDEGESGEGEDAQAAPEQVNDPTPLWMKKPTDCTDEEYKAFYHKVFKDYDEPLFWIHLNAEYPFNLKGILYFPKIKNEFSSSEGTIKLYNNQVFVADNIKEVIPEFLMLLKGAIDCPDLPLNVSRSFLQNDGYVKKMSAYITRKVADRLVSEFTGKREDYQKYWDDIHPFVKYGCVRDQKFYERVKDALLLKTVDDKYLTIKEYTDANCDSAKEEKVIYYASDKKRQAQMIELYTHEGKDVVVLDTLIDNNFMSFLEYSGSDKDMKLKFLRVDAGIDGLTEEGEASEETRKALEDKFREALHQEDLTVKLTHFKQDSIPAMMTVDEQSRRFSDMSKVWGNQGFSMPVTRTLALNAKHPLIQYLERSTDPALDQMIVEQVADLAEMARSPLEEGRMVAFLKRSTELLTKLTDQ